MTKKRDPRARSRHPRRRAPLLESLEGRALLSHLMEAPKGLDHWYPGGGIGMARGADAQIASGPMGQEGPSLGDQAPRHTFTVVYYRVVLTRPSMSFSYIPGGYSERNSGSQDPPTNSPDAAPETHSSPATPSTSPTLPMERAVPLSRPAFGSPEFASRAAGPAPVQTASTAVFGRAEATPAASTRTAAAGPEVVLSTWIDSSVAHVSTTTNPNGVDAVGTTIPDKTPAGAGSGIEFRVAQGPSSLVTLTVAPATPSAAPAPGLRGLPGRPLVARAPTVPPGVPETEAASEETTEALVNPLPSGADLITRLAPFDRESFERALAQWRQDLLGQAPEGEVTVSSFRPLVWVGAALAAFIATRRGKTKGWLSPLNGQGPRIGAGGLL